MIEHKRIIAILLAVMTVVMVVVVVLAVKQKLSVDNAVQQSEISQPTEILPVSTNISDENLKQLKEIEDQVKAGNLSAEEAQKQLKAMGYEFDPSSPSTVVSSDVHKLTEDEKKAFLESDDPMAKGLRAYLNSKSDGPTSLIK